MMESVSNHNNCNNNRQQFVVEDEQQQHLFQLSDHLKCGEVYTWLCAGELYAIECKLCEDQPLCPLSEFPQHMQVWHTDWEQNQENEDTYSDDNDDVEHYCEYNKPALPFTTENNDLFESNHQLENKRILQHEQEHGFHPRQNEEEILEPFEQVLIEQDNDTDSIQINDYINEQESLNEQQKPVTTLEEVTETRCKQTPQFNINNTDESNCKQRDLKSKITVKETELRYLEETTFSVKKLNVNHLTEQQYNEKSFDSEAIKDTFKPKPKNNEKYKINANNLNKIKINEALITENENDLAETSKTLQNSNKAPERVKQKLTQSTENKINLRSCAIKITNTKDIRSIQIETSENQTSETVNVEEPKNDKKFKFLKNIRQNGKKLKNVQKQTRNLKTVENNLKKTIQRYSERNKSERKIGETAKGTIKTEKNNLRFIKIQNLKNINSGQNNKKNSQTLIKTGKAKTLLKVNFKQLRRVKENQLVLTENKTTCKKSAKLEKYETQPSENTTVKLSKTQKKENETQLSENEIKIKVKETGNIARKIQINKSETITKSETSKNESKQTKYKKIKRSTRKNYKPLAKTKENKSKLNEIRKFKLNESEIFKNKNETQQYNHIKTTGDKQLNENKLEQNENETEKTNEMDSQLSENLFVASAIKTNVIEDLKAKDKQKLYEIKTIFKLGKTKKNNDSLSDKPQIRKSLRNLGKSKEIITSDSRSLIKNRELGTKVKQLGEEEQNGMEQEEIIKADIGVCVNIVKLPNESKNFIKSEQITAVKRNPKKFSEELNQEELDKRKTQQLRRKIINSKNKKKILKLEQPKRSSKANSLKEKSETEDQTDLETASKSSSREQTFEITHDSFKDSDAASNSTLEDSTLSSLYVSNPYSPSKLSSEGYCSNRVEDETDLDSPFKSVNAEQTFETTENLYKESDAAFIKSLDDSALNTSYATTPSKLFTEEYCSSNERSSSLINDPLSFLRHKTVKKLSPTSCNEAIALLSSKTEEKSFEFNESKDKLITHHISHLIKLYQEHPRLWDQSHPDFCETQVCRKSWQQITDQWNEYCNRKFSTVEVRIRLGNLCQRYLQEQERLTLEGELDEFAKFPYYEQMRFLEQQKTLQKRRKLYEQQNEKILEIYQNFPLLWHVSCYKLRQAKERAQAYASISKALKICGIHLSSMGVQKRVRSLRKCYRLEKIRFLHAQVEQKQFETDFRHYERMAFLHKHIEPFVCGKCGKIFEKLVGFRGHLEEENHGTVLQDNEECKSGDENAGDGKFTENEWQEKKISTVEKTQGLESHQVKNKSENLVPVARNCDEVFCSELENSSDILQTFTPLSTTPAYELETTASKSNHTAIIQEVLVFPPNTTAKSMTNSLCLEDQLIEEIMDDITNDEKTETLSLNHFNESFTSCKEWSPSSCVTEESSCMNVINAEHINILQNADVSTVQTLDAGYTETKAEEREQIAIGNHPTPLSPLVVKLQCADFSLDLNLNSEFSKHCNINSNPNDSDFADLSTTPLPDHQIHIMIGLYRKYPQLWNPNHLDYNSRKLRRQAWYLLTTEFNTVINKQFSWRTMHRKLTDYAKYYKKLITDQEDYEQLENKWTFYEDFKFLDDVIAVHNELQRSVHHPDNIFKIIAIYKTLPQLWDIKHADFNKRSMKQRNFELMCNRLQDEYNLQLTTERLKNRLIELRAQYRIAKKQRLKCERNQQHFTNDFEFYEAIKFIDPHIDPFICELCKMDFKKLTDYKEHLKRVHEKKITAKTSPVALIPHEPGLDKSLENICHICGLKFTTRSNLAHHVRRHENIRNYQCPMCPKKFFDSYPLKVHIRSHTKECPFTCEKCGMSFVSASKLNLHAKRHYDKKDYKCDYCPKAFYTGFEKDRHEKRHLNIRDKVCPICGKAFVMGSSYYAHMMLHNDKKRFECDKCNMKFAQYAGLYKHKKRHHS